MSAIASRKVFALVAFAVLLVSFVGVSPAHAQGPVQVISGVPFVIPNPCNNHALQVTATAVIKNDQNGFSMTLANGKGVDTVDGTTYNVIYVYGAGGPSSFILELRIVATGGPGSGLAFSEIDQFMVNGSTGFTRVNITQTCG